MFKHLTMTTSRVRLVVLSWVIEVEGYLKVCALGYHQRELWNINSDFFLQLLISRILNALDFV